MSATPPPGPSAVHDDFKRAPEIIQNNVGLANDYRIELRKQLLTMATAIFAFTVSLFPQHVSSQASPTALAWLGWVFLLFSIASGLGSLGVWESFYISYRDYDNKGNGGEGDARREKLTSWRRALDRTQMATLLIGAVMVAIFAATRLGT